MNQARNVLAIDVGSKRIGVARASTLARLAMPLKIIEVNGQEMEEIKNLCNEESASTLVVGLPRGLNGQDTDQTRLVREFAKQLEEQGLPVKLQDEAGTSKEAKANIKDSSQFVDAHAAAIILQDYLDNL